MNNIQNKVEPKELKLNGYAIHYYCSGDSTKDLILFLHPAFADHRCFDRQVDFFSNNYRVITLDMLGHGLSQPNNTKDKIDKAVNHIDQILSSEGYSKAHLAGVSVGSLIAQYYGLLHPDKVSSMTILGGYDINADNRQVLKAQRQEQIKWILTALFSMNSFRRHVARAAVASPEAEQHFFKMAKLFTRKSFMVMSGLSQVLRKRHGISLTYPVLIMCGEMDSELAKQLSLKWHESEPGSNFHLIRDAGHCANMDNSVTFNGLLNDFIKQQK